MEDTVTYFNSLPTYYTCECGAIAEQREHWKNGEHVSNFGYCPSCQDEWEEEVLE